MSREIKFRVWNKESSSYVDNIYEAYMGELIEFAINSGGHLSIRTLHGSYSAENNSLEGYDCLYEQFTGLKDKNGTEIYEGDILSIDFYEEFSNECVTVDCEGDHCPIVKVLWDCEGYWLFSESDGTWYFPQSLDDCATFEVIGNIHQNPELLPCK